MTLPTPKITDTSWSRAVDLRLGLHVGEYAPGGGLAAQWDVGTWDVSKWGTAAGADPDAPGAVWEWLDCDVLAVSTHRGKAAWSNQYDAGSLTATLYNLAGNYTLDYDKPSMLVPLEVGRLIRLQARPTDSADWLSVFTGQVTGLTETMTAAGVATVAVAAADAFSYLGRRTFLAEGTTPPTETVDVRLDRILDKAQWPDYRRDLEPAAATLHGSSLATNALQEGKLAAESVGGDLFVDERGRVAFRSRDWDVTNPAIVGVLTGIRGEDPDYQTSPPRYCLTDPLTLTRAIDRIVNTVDLTSGSGTSVAHDPISAEQYGPRPYIRTNLTTAEQSELDTLAAAILARHKDATTRLQAATMPLISTDDAAWACARSFGDRVRLHYQHPVFGWDVDLETTIIGIDHTISGETWLVTFTTDTAPTT